MKVAIRAIKRRSPREIVVALPVAPSDILMELAEEADKIICLSKPARFCALSYHYRNFPQLSDGEVVNLLKRQRPDNIKSNGNRE